MDKISTLPSVLIRTNEDAPLLAALPKRHWVRQLWRGFWRLLSLVQLSWDILSHIPPDLYLSAGFMDRADPRESISVDDRLDLHSKLPLLIISAKGSLEVRVYNTETREELWTLRIDIPEDTRNDQATVKSSITCLKFSKGNQVAVGLSDGTVRFIEQDFATLIKSRPPLKPAAQPKSERVKLLPLLSSRVNANFAGCVSNLAFSPSTTGLLGDDIWLAVATEKAGIWIWSRRTGEAIRAVSTAGINEGCLHWVSVSANQETRPAIRKRLPLSKWRRWSSFFKEADETSLMDRYLAPSPGRADFPAKLTWSAPPHAPDSQPIGSSMGVFGGHLAEADKDSHFGESFLVFGTKTGRLQIQRLWHSSTTMVRETSIEPSPTAFAQSPQRLTHRFGPASGAITHLVMQSPNLTTSEAKLTILMTSQNDAGSTIPVHRFSISLPFHEPLESWRGWVPAVAAGLLRPLVNFFLAGTEYRWLSRRIWPAEGGHRLLKNVDHARSPIRLAHVPPKAAITSVSALANTPYLLTTTNEKWSYGAERDTCTVRRYDDSIPTLALNTVVRPLVPAPAPQQEEEENLILGLGLRNTGHEATERRPPGTNRPDHEDATHEYHCGRVAWGQQKQGEAVGAFVYQPASARDPSVAVGLLKIQY